MLKNFTQLATSALRQNALTIAAAGLKALDVRTAVGKALVYIPRKNILRAGNLQYKIKDYKRIFCLGFGRISAAIALDTVALLTVAGCRVEYLKDYEAEVFLPNDLVLAITTEEDFFNNISQNEILAILTKQGAMPKEIELVARHLENPDRQAVKRLYPTAVLNICIGTEEGCSIFVPDISANFEVAEVLRTYNVFSALDFHSIRLSEPPKEKKYFEKVSRLALATPRQALEAMQQQAEDLGFKTKTLLSPEKMPFLEIVELAKKGLCLIGCQKAGNFFTQALAVLPHIRENQVLLCAALGLISDNNTQTLSVIIADGQTVGRAKVLGLEPQSYLSNSGSFGFFEHLGDGVMASNPGPIWANFWLLIEE